MNTIRTFRLYWLTKRNNEPVVEVVTGYDIADAFRRAGYGAGAMAALDWYEEI